MVHQLQATNLDSLISMQSSSHASLSIVDQNQQKLASKFSPSTNNLIINQNITAPPIASEIKFDSSS